MRRGFAHDAFRRLAHNYFVEFLLTHLNNLFELTVELKRAQKDHAELFFKPLKGVMVEITASYHACMHAPSHNNLRQIVHWQLGSYGAFNVSVLKTTGAGAQAWNAGSLAALSVSQTLED